MDGASSSEIENQTNNVENGKTIQFMTKALRSVRMTLVQHWSQRTHTNSEKSVYNESCPFANELLCDVK